MLAITAAALQFVTLVDETICSRQPSYLAIPYDQRMTAVIDSNSCFILVKTTHRRVTWGRMVHFVEFSGDIEHDEATSDRLPAYFLPVSSRPTHKALKSYKRCLEADDVGLLVEFWEAWRPVNEAIDEGSLDVDGWDEWGRMFLKGKHRGEEFKIPDFFISGIGKHL